MMGERDLLLDEAACGLAKRRGLFGECVCRRHVGSPSFQFCARRMSVAPNNFLRAPFVAIILILLNEIAFHLVDSFFCRCQCPRVVEG